ncbi:MAG: arsenic resistance protein, partial [bacterium]
NFVLAPFLCWVLAFIILHSYPDLAIGLILVGVTPCAGMAMVWTSMMKGNVPLSIVINASTMILAPFLIPGLMKVLTGSYVHINVMKMFEDLTITLLFPVAAGIASRWIVEHTILKSDEKIRHYLDIFSSISAVMAMLLMFMTINTSVQMILKHLALLLSLVASTALVFPIMFGLTHFLSKKLFDYGSDIAITYSSGMKNLPIAMSIAITSFKEISALPIAVGFIFQMITAVGFYRIFRRLSSRGGVNV